ncbi:hypothetical protein L6452_39316 [Arctium lappa]|uniref:Uncharacterized protein n=1 Tax=Arctium lappa TaxID=4217 RepID=A0ACB8XRG2_ARCLA|nr:hypothetical protein L6452_39316 [Arctium lappa]
MWSYLLSTRICVIWIIRKEESYWSIIGNMEERDWSEVFSTTGKYTMLHSCRDQQAAALLKGVSFERLETIFNLEFVCGPLLNTLLPFSGFSILLSVSRSRDRRSAQNLGK